MSYRPMFLLLAICFITTIKAQKDFRPGYIIKLNGDTIFGEIDYRSDEIMATTCSFKEGPEKNTVYTPQEIKAYRFTESKYYISKQIEEKQVFLEFLIKGKLNIYYLRDENGDHYYLSKDDGDLVEIPYEQGKKYVNSKYVYYETKQHKGILKYSTLDAPELHQRIANFKKPNHLNLIKIAKDYHNIVCSGHECVIFEKQIPAIKILPEVIFGPIRYFNLDKLKDTFTYQWGGILHFWLPRANEKVYFRTGVLTNTIEYTDEKISYYKIPVQFEYIYPKGIFRPRMAYGVDVFLPYYHSVSLNFGANIHVSKTILLSLTSDLEFDPAAAILPEYIIATSVNIGVLLKI